MNPPFCELLDDYLLDELTLAERQRYEEHLEDCPACRTGIAQQQRIDSLLKSTIESIPLPDHLLTTSRTHTPKPHRASPKIAAVVVASLVIAIVGWMIRGEPQPVELIQDDQPKELFVPPVESPEKVVQETQLTPKQQPTPQPEPIVNNTPTSPVTVDFPDGVIAVPIETEYDDITIMQVFPVSDISLTD